MLFGSDEIVKRETAWRLAEAKQSAPLPLRVAGPALPPPPKAQPTPAPPPAKKAKLMAPVATPLPPKPAVATSDPFWYLLRDGAKRKAGRLALRTQLGLTHVEILEREQKWRTKNSGCSSRPQEPHDPNRGRAFKGDAARHLLRGATNFP